MTTFGRSLSSILRASEVVQILTKYRACEREETWARRECDASLRAVRIDMINTVREEMRDQVVIVLNSLESLMFMSTLVLTVGFGIVCEGTFPDPEVDGTDYEGYSDFFLEFYAVLCGLNLVLPLGSLMVAIAIRREAEHCLCDVTEDLHTHVKRALRCEWPNERISRRKDTSYYNLCRDHDEHALAAAMEDVRVVHSLAHGLLRKVRYFNRLYPVAKLLLGLGMLSAVGTCSVLFGLIFEKHFPSMPELYLVYSGTVFGGTALSAAFCGWIFYSIRRSNPISSYVYSNGLGSLSPALLQQPPKRRSSKAGIHMQQFSPDAQISTERSTVATRVLQVLGQAGKQVRHALGRGLGKGHSHGLSAPLLG